jgi:sulfate adenylyltransferase subunit 1 (EFTu-like GTPase family)
MNKKPLPPVPRNEWPELLTAQDLADLMRGYFGINRAYALFQSGIIPVQKIGPANIISAADFFTWFDGSDIWEKCIKTMDAMWDETEEYITVKIPVDSIKKLPDEVKKLLKK